MRVDAVTRDRVVAKISARLHEPAANITDETVLTDLGFDSLDLVETSMEIEEELEVEFTDDDLETAKTVGELLDLVARKIVAKAAA